MFFGFELLPLLSATLVVLAVGIVWYAPQVFGRVWAEDLDLDTSLLDIEAPGALRRLVLAGVLNFVVMFFLANLVALATAAKVSPIKVVVGLLVIILAVSTITALNERRGLVSFAVTMSYVSLSMLTGVAIIAYWPW